MFLLNKNKNEHSAFWPAGGAPNKWTWVTKTDKMASENLKFTRLGWGRVHHAQRRTCWPSFVTWIFKAYRRRRNNTDEYTLRMYFHVCVCVVCWGLTSPFEQLFLFWNQKKTGTCLLKTVSIPARFCLFCLNIWWGGKKLEFRFMSIVDLLCV